MAELRKLGEPIPKEEEEERKKNRSKHNSTYYEKNKTAIIEARKKRYLEDPEYREEVLRRAREAKKKQSQEKRARLKEQNLRYETPTLFKVCLPDGREIETEMYTTGQLAMRLDRKAQTIFMWEKTGALPKAMYRDLRGWRLYTAFQVREMAKYYASVEHSYGQQVARFKLSRTKFFKKTFQLWANYPYGVEELEGPGYVKITED
jgi:DNA-binding transcriptional MerR regulator